MQKQQKEKENRRLIPVSGGGFAVLTAQQQDYLSILNGIMRNVKGRKEFTTISEFAKNSNPRFVARDITPDQVNALIVYNLKNLSKCVESYPNLFEKAKFEMTKGYPLQRKDSIEKFAKLLTEKLDGKSEISFKNDKKFQFSYQSMEKAYTL